MKHMLSFGHGFSARALTPLLLAQGFSVTGTTRSQDKLAGLDATGVTAKIWPGTDLRKELKSATHLLLSAAPNADGDPVLNAMRDDIAAHAPNLEWVGYLSTTGVYGDADGGWVDEESPLNPSTKRGQMRVDAEAEWQSIANLPLHIFRLAGIYGPGRGPFAKVRAGTARRIIKKGQVFSRIHVEDIAQILAASIAQPNAGAIYNMCDDDPAPPQDVIAYAAELLGMPLPEEVDFETADMTPMARSFYAESNYRAGLTSLLALENALGEHG
jgi:nucleoside-diphosphate-sugar epimerase